VTDLFKEKAKEWNMHETRQQLSTNISRSIIESGSFSEDMKVMDFGAGTGLIAGNIASLVNKIFAKKNLIEL
jgi:tRNA A58 N-methylase Trm61